MEETNNRPTPSQSDYLDRFWYADYNLRNMNNNCVGVYCFRSFVLIYGTY